MASARPLLASLLDFSSARAATNPCLPAGVCAAAGCAPAAGAVSSWASMWRRVLPPAAAAASVSPLAARLRFAPVAALRCIGSVPPACRKVAASYMHNTGCSAGHSVDQNSAALYPPRRTCASGTTQLPVAQRTTAQSSPVSRCAIAWPACHSPRHAPAPAHRPLRPAGSASATTLA